LLQAEDMNVKNKTKAIYFKLSRMFQLHYKETIK